MFIHGFCLLFLYSVSILISQSEEMWKISEIEMVKVIESCMWSLIISSLRIWKIGVLIVMQPEEVDVIVFHGK